MSTLTSRLSIVAVVGFFSLLLSPNESRSQDFDQWIENLKSHLRMSSGPHSEGSQDNRNSVGTGSVKDWITYPGEIYVEPESSRVKYRGTIAVHFSGRERVADYVLNVQRDTNDYQTSGRVTATYEFTFSGRVSITDVAKHGGRGRVGNAVVDHVRGVHGADVRSHGSVSESVESELAVPREAFGEIASLAPCESVFDPNSTIYLSVSSFIGVSPQASANFKIRTVIVSSSEDGTEIAGGISECTLAPGDTRDAGVICLHNASKPGKYTLRAALTAQRLPGGRIQVLDSRTCTYSVRDVRPQ